MTMGQIIRHLRKERNLTQEELAKQLNVTPQAVSRWENETGLPDVTQVVPLASVFGVSVDVLFGTSGINGEEEVDTFLKEMERTKFDHPEEGSGTVFWRERCEAIRNMLKTYPNNIRLLYTSIVNIVFLLREYRDEETLPDRESEIKGWMAECVREANVIFGCCTDIGVLMEINERLVSAYRIMGDYDKAEEYAMKIAKLDGTALATVYNAAGRTEEAMKQYGVNIANALFRLGTNLPLLGYAWRRQKQYEEAYACYHLIPALCETMFGDGEEEILPHEIMSGYGWCAVSCMDLGKPDEAMYWLERWVRHERTNAKNYNKITESKLPYFYEMRTEGVYDSYPRNHDITMMLEFDSFDPIREIERFKQIVKNAEAFERGE